MSSKISDERLAELREQAEEDRLKITRALALAPSKTSPALIERYEAEEAVCEGMVNALDELAEYRAREAESTSQYGYQEPEYGTVWVPCETAEEAAAYGQPGDTLVRRLVGPWEKVSDDD